MTGKLSKGASERLLNLLYATTLVETANITPLVTKFIHDHQISPAALSHTSILDDLTATHWNQKPFAHVASDLPQVHATQVHSNILRFNCRNNYISRSTFSNLYPINRERKYKLPGPASGTAGKPIKLSVVKARDPLTLQPLGIYYLVFNSFEYAAAYWLETLGKVINGFDLKLEFTSLGPQELYQMSSPYFHNGSVDLDTLKGNSKNLISDPSHLFDGLSILSTYHDLANHTQLSSTGNKVVYDPISVHKYLNIPLRKSSVLVRNLPFGLSKHTLPKLLWDYDLESNPGRSITTIAKDPIKQVHLRLIQFADEVNAARFVRTYHGKKWDTGIQSQKEKKLYEPILCEIVD